MRVKGSKLIGYKQGIHRLHEGCPTQLANGTAIGRRLHWNRFANFRPLCRPVNHLAFISVTHRLAIGRHGRLRRHGRRHGRRHRCGWLDDVGRQTGHGHDTTAYVRLGIAATAAAHVLATSDHLMRLHLSLHRHHRMAGWRLLRRNMSHRLLLDKLVRRHEGATFAVAACNVVKDGRNGDANHRHLVLEDGRSGRHGRAAAASSTGHSVVLIARLVRLLLFFFLANDLVSVFVFDGFFTGTDIGR